MYFVGIGFVIEVGQVCVYDKVGQMCVFDKVGLMCGYNK